MRYSTFFLQMIIRGYQLFLSPLLGPRCRYFPSCSEYAMEALGRHGAWHGGKLTIKRLLRCHPWGRSGLDPVPHNHTSPYCNFNK